MSVTEKVGLGNEDQPATAHRTAPLQLIATCAAVIGLTGYLVLPFATRSVALALSTHGAIWLCLSAGFWSAARSDARSGRGMRRLAFVASMLATTGALAVLSLAAASRFPVSSAIEVVPIWPALLLLPTSFSLLVLERWSNSISVDSSQESLGLALMLKAAFGAAVATIIVLLALHLGFGWPTIILKGLSILTAAVAFELLARALFRAFLPESSRQILQVRSTIIDLLLSGHAARDHLESSVKRRLGVDLERNWALGLFARSAVPAAAGLLLAGWLLTGVREITFDTRGVYERFGVASGVLAPGIHITLPWPFGHVRMVENGTIHEVDLVSEDANSPPSTVLVGADDPAPASADRLWDTAHRGEVSYLIAGLSDHGQSFEAVDVDVRFVYRMGLSDDAALASVYKATEPAELVRTWGGRLLMRYFAVRALDTVLGDAREELSSDLATSLQTDLDTLGSGIEVLGAVIEAIHPPAGAANAYHQVQAAEIRAEARILSERGSASQSLNEALTQASTAVDRSVATAAEVQSEAAADKVRFAADRVAATSGGASFVFERYLDGLSRGLASKRLIIMDHRLTPGMQPTFDLRAPASAGDLAGLPGLLGSVAKPE